MADRNSAGQENLKSLTSPANVLQVAFIVAILIALYFISTVNFLLFHGIVELAGIAVAFSIFIIVWNTRRDVNDAFFLIVGISFFFIGCIDLVHTLAYKGMGVFPGNNADLPTQLWIVARYFQSITFLVATFFIGRSITRDRKYDVGIIIAACTAACTFLFASIFVWQNFPHCFIEGSGLTPFKIVSEYIISLILVATIGILYLKREHFDPTVWKFLIAAQVFLIPGELAFSTYISVYGFTNMLGHLFCLISVYLFYRAFVVVALTRPYDLLLHELKVNDDALRDSEAKNRAIYEGSNDAVMLLTEKGFFDCNPRTLQMFGLRSREEFVHYHPAELSPPTQPDGRPSLEAAMGHIQAAFRNGIDRFEWMHRRKNGEDFPAEVLLSACNYGKKRVLQATVRDITDRKMTDDALKRSERHLADIINFLPDATFVIDRNRTVIAWNKAMEEMTGVPAGQMLGKGDHEYAIPFYGHRRPILIDLALMPDEEIEKNYYHIIQKEGDLLIAETDLSRPMGKIVNLWGKATPLYDDKGNKVGAIESIRDVTDRKQAELALRQSEDKYRTLFENSGSPLMIIDEDTTILLVNRKFENISGYTKEEIEGRKSWTEFVADTGDLERMKEYHRLRRVSPELAPVTYESRIIMRTGDIRNMIVTVAMIPATKQSLAALVDITDHKRAEEALRRSEERFREIFDNSNDAIYLVASPKDGSVGTNIAVNRKAVEMLGYSEREFMKMTPRDIHDPATLSDVLNVQEMLAGTGHVIIQTNHRAKDGRIIPVELSIHRFLLGEEMVSLVVARDITERKKADEALHTSEERFRGIASNLPGIVYQFYARDTGEWGMYFVDGRSRDVYGLNPEPLDTWYERYASCIAPEDRQRWVESINDVVIKVAPWDFEGRFIKPTGEEMYIRGLSQPVRLQNETVWNGILLDITERRKAEEELRRLYTELEQRVAERTADLRQAQDAFRQANEKLNLLSSITRHDILNQLMALSGFLELSRMKIHDDAVGEYIRKAQHAAVTIGRHISFTKQYQDIGVKSPVWQNVRECVEKPVTDLLPASVTCTVDLDEIEIYADPLFEKVLYTLVDNTLRHGERVTLIRFSYRMSDTGELILLYDDNGVGIRADDKERIFERGFGKHTGFGLFLAREILAITGITIRETGTEETGARFEIAVPKGAYRFKGTT
ncbi:MAG: PAS domain S-box protein [Methanoregula sp.]